MNFKKFLPFENYILTTKLSVDEVRKLIADNVESKENSFFSFSNRKSTKPYEGHISGDTFSISRIISYRNSFLPVISGRITTFPGETQIKIKMQPATFVLIFISFWLGIVGLMCVGIIVAGILQFRQILQNGFTPMTLIPFGMFLFGCLLTTFAFKGESKNSKAFLERLLEGHETTD